MHRISLVILVFTAAIQKYMKEFLIITFQGIAAFAALAAVIITVLLNWSEGFAPENFTAIRYIALNLLRNNKTLQEDRS